MKHLSLQKKPPFCSGVGGGSNTRTSCGEKVLYHRGRDQESGAGTYKISYLDVRSLSSHCLIHLCDHLPDSLIVPMFACLLSDLVLKLYCTWYSCFCSTWWYMKGTYVCIYRFYLKHVWNPVTILSIKWSLCSLMHNGWDPKIGTVIPNSQQGLLQNISKRCGVHLIAIISKDD